MDRVTYVIYEDGLKIKMFSVIEKSLDYASVLDQAFRYASDYLKTVKIYNFNLVISKDYSENIINIYLLTRGKFNG